MSEYEALVNAIVEQMRKIVGPVAFTQAKRVDGMVFNENKVIKIRGSPDNVISALIAQYKSLIGRVVITIAKKAAARFLAANPKLKLPKELIE